MEILDRRSMGGCGWHIYTNQLRCHNSGKYRNFSQFRNSKVQSIPEHNRNSKS